MKLSVKKATLLATIFAGAFVLFGQSPSVSASTVQEMTADMTNKMYYSALKNCVKVQTIGEINTKDFKSWNNIFYSSAGSQHFPDGWYGGDTKSCSDVIGKIVGTTSIPIDEAERGLLLSNIGFTKKEGDTNTNASKQCLEVNFKKKRQDSNSDSSIDDGDYTTPEICLYLDGENRVTSANIDSALNNVNYPVLLNASQGYIEIRDMTIADSIPVSIGYTGKTFEEVANEVTATLASLRLRIDPTEEGQTASWYEIERNDQNTPVWHRIVHPDEEANAKGTYVRPADPMSVFNAIISKYSAVKDGIFSASERVSLYQFYLKNNAQSVCNPEDGWTPGASFQKVRLVIKSEYYNDCYSSNINGGNNFAGFNGSGEFDYATKIDFNRIISELNSTTASDKEGVIDPGATLGTVDGEDANPNPIDPETGLPENGDDASSSTSESDVCYGASGTLGLGWILCPVATFLSNTLNGFYNNIVSQFLEVNPQFLATGSGQDNVVSTYEAWQIFQNIANILLVIFFLVVIFSQLTGLGIDNYGIKKMLPRIIICAILINLSYFIAQFLVDVSNIVGSGIQGIFNTGVPGNLDFADAPTVPEEVIGITLTAAGVGLAGLAIFSNPALFVSFLVTLLSGLISVLTAWVILIARQVGVIVAVVLSPVAFALYILPNTSKLTKSWINLMKGLLLLYPLCSLVVGASAFVSRVLFGLNGGAAMVLAAILVKVIPFLAIPTLFKKSLDAFGNLGTRIQGIGRDFGRGTTRRITSSEGYKNMQKSSLDRQNRLRAGINKKTGDLNAIGRAKSKLAGTWFGNLGYGSMQASRVARARKAREEDIQETAELGEALTRSELAKGRATNRQDYLRDQLISALSSGSTNDYFAAVDQATKSGMKSSDIAKITREIFDGGHWGGSLTDEKRRGNFLQEFANRYGGSFLKKDAEQKSWAATRAGLDTSTGVHSLAGFAAAGGMETADLKDNEVIDLSADRLHELLRDGIIDRSQAQRVWSSGANMDSINKLMLGALGTRGELINKADAQTMTAKNYSGGMHGLTAQAVQALTEATPQDTVIRDVRWKNEYGEKRQTNPLVTARDPNVGQFVTFRKDQGNGAANNLSLVQQWDGSFYDPSTGRYFSEDTLRKGGYRRT